MMVRKMYLLSNMAIVGIYVKFQGIQNPFAANRRSLARAFEPKSPTQNHSQPQQWGSLEKLFVLTPTKNPSFFSSFKIPQIRKVSDRLFFYL